MTGPGEDCGCGNPMHTKRLTKAGVFAVCAHCDYACLMGALCRFCIRIGKAVKP